MELPSIFFHVCWGKQRWFPVKDLARVSCCEALEVASQKVIMLCHGKEILRADSIMSVFVRSRSEILSLCKWLKVEVLRNNGPFGTGRNLVSGNI